MNKEHGCNYLEPGGYCARHDGLIDCRGPDTCPDWAQVYAIKELTATVKSIAKTYFNSEA